MAQLEPVHVLERDRATDRMVVTRINPTRTFVDRGPNGNRTFTWQNGVWFDQGGQSMDADVVPKEYRDVMASHPVVIEQFGPEIIWTCEFCDQTMNSAEKDTHLVQHVRDALGKAGTPQTPTPREPPKRSAA